MSETISDGVCDALLDLLELERDALLSGDLDKIGRLLPRKESLVEQLSCLETFDETQMEIISQNLKRNQDLLNQAIAGIRSVAGRLKVLKNVQSSLETYDNTGARRTVDISPSTSLEKRA